MYGVDGNVYQDRYCATTKGGDPTGLGVCQAGIEYRTARNTLGAQLVRANGTLGCGAWNTEGGRWQKVFMAMDRAWRDGLIPLVTINANDRCPQQSWYNELFGFAQWMDLYHFARDPLANNLPLYIELGNELNVQGQHPTYCPLYIGSSDCTAHYQYTPSSSQYPSDFAGGAEALYYQFRAFNRNYTQFHILTAGITSPAADFNNCASNDGNLLISSSAISTAIHDPGMPVPPQFLGAAVHPYGYNTLESDRLNSFKNIQNFGFTGTACNDLQWMLSNWRSMLDEFNGNGPPLPLVISEINFVSTPNTSGADPRYGETEILDANRDAAYLADLFSWFDDHLVVSTRDYALKEYPLRVMWYSGADDIAKPFPQGQPTPTPPPNTTPTSHQVRPFLGLYSRDGHEKLANIGTCPQIFYPQTGGTTQLDQLYYYLSSVGLYCY